MVKAKDSKKTENTKKEDQIALEALKNLEKKDTKKVTKKKDTVSWNNMNKVERVFFILAMLSCIGALVLIGLEMTKVISDRAWESLALALTSFLEVFVYWRQSRKYAIFSLALAFMFGLVFSIYMFGF